MNSRPSPIGGTLPRDHRSYPRINKYIVTTHYVVHPQIFTHRPHEVIATPIQYYSVDVLSSYPTFGVVTILIWVRR